MNAKSIIVAAALALAASGCANYRPVVDMQGVSEYTYEADLRDCQSYAAQVDPGAHAAGGAIAGALIGALLGAAVGGHGNIGFGAGVGAAYGGSGGAVEGATSQRAIIQRCMIGRGYRVLY